ncbi:MFS transporter [Olleya sp. HaHaR_3_96]|uniref:MFS transporter n=1 Tax=Olleya sp. HaHaR_3_96 TaxID=2745560 RepID=UPI001C4F1872|nr:MFS transporter [Olleya sp. HaHaR_3_96]QXP59741.1 MFS transporter [Olleya sp. HaHaR_3_96]
MKKLLKNYISTFDGLSKEVWWLSLITLINRAGTMVIPFLSLYLTEDLGFTLSNVGTIMTAFGLGSVIGSWLGGKLTDKIGYYKIMVFSLFISGFMFIGLQYLKTIYTLSLGIFALMVVADMFRPAMFVALSAYSKPENKTRSVTLIRLAINLGFSAGPAVGGLIIVSLGYGGLFWVDGITCIAATLLLIKVLNPKKTRVQDDIKVDNPYSAYKDKPFILFLFALFLFGFIFLQYFSTMPLYYRERHLLSELEIGLLLGANGFFIFLLEMPLIKYLENTRFSKIALILFGAFLTAISFLILNFSSWSGILIFAMFLMTVGEMIAFPFANAFALQQAKKGNQGEYMALYSIAFSFAHIFGHKSGMELVEGVGYDNTWYIMTLLGGLCMLLLYFLNQFMKGKKLAK